MRLVIAEKPSVAKNLARVMGARVQRNGWIEGKDLKITWCIGHLVQLQEPAHYSDTWSRWSLETLPMIPEKFALGVRENVAKQWSTVRSLLRDNSLKEVVNACDAGREGELIFRYAYELAGCKAPTSRLWVSSMTDEAISNALKNLRPGTKYDALADAARCRSEADWLVGLNATRAMTCLGRRSGGGALLSLGRVQTPTLSMVVQRDLEIEDFTSKPFWQISGKIEAEVEGKKVHWEARWFQQEPGARKKLKKGEENTDDRLNDRAVAKAIQTALQGREGKITRASRRRKIEPPPLLYDLTSLQRRANQRYGLSAQKTLDVAQALYEKHKLLTYPRTDARFLTPDQAPTLPGILKAVAKEGVYAPFVESLRGKPLKPGKRIINAAEVGDHHAILPTAKPPQFNRLDSDERKIYDLVARRLLAALSPEALFDMTDLVVSIGKKSDKLDLPEKIKVPLTLRAKGRICRQEGWRAIDPPGKSRDTELPVVDKGDAVLIASSKLKEGKTRPPRAHNDATLLRSMETAGKELEDAELKRALRSGGLGTPATRASTLQTLIQRGFMERKGRDLCSTTAGRALIKAIPVEELKSALMTGRWEARLSAMADGKEGRKAFMDDVKNYVRELVGEIKGAKLPSDAFVGMPNDGGPKRAQLTGPVLGECPKCKTPVREGKGAFACEGGFECSFVIFKTVSERPITPKEARLLLDKGRTGTLKGFKDRKGQGFEAALFLSDEGKAAFVQDGEILGECPLCKKAVREGRSVFNCEGGRSCDFVIFKTVASLPIDVKIVKALLKDSKTKTLDGFKSKAGKDFSAALILDERGQVKFDFAARSLGPVGMRCPSCKKGRLIRGRAAWGCDKWRDACNYRLDFSENGRRLGDDEAADKVRAARK